MHCRLRAIVMPHELMLIVSIGDRLHALSQALIHHQSNICEHEKRQEPFPVPTLFVGSEFIEHSTMHRVHHPLCKVRRKCVVVSLIQREISQFPVLDDVLIEEAVQRPPLCQSQRGKVAF